MQALISFYLFGGSHDCKGSKHVNKKIFCIFIDVVRGPDKLGRSVKSDKNIFLASKLGNMVRSICHRPLAIGPWEFVPMVRIGAVHRSDAQETQILKLHFRWATRILGKRT